MRKSWSLRDHGGFLATIVDLQAEEAVKKGVQIKSSGKYSLKGEKRREKEKEEGEGGKRREKERGEREGRRRRKKERGEREGRRRGCFPHHRWSNAFIISCLRGMESASCMTDSTSAVSSLTCQNTPTHTLTLVRTHH